MCFRGFVKKANCTLAQTVVCVAVIDRGERTYFSGIYISIYIFMLTVFCLPVNPS